MAKYKITGPDGATYSVTAPDDATQEEVLAYAQQQFGQRSTDGPRQAGGANSMDDFKAKFQQELSDMNPLEAALIGAGRTTSQIIDGLKQLGFELTGNTDALERLATKQGQDKQAYKPLQDAQPISTAFGEALPGMAIPVGGGATLASTVARLGAAGAIPGALEYGTARERAGRAAAGGGAAIAGGTVIPAVGRGIAKAVPAAGRTVRALTEPFTAGGREAIAGRTLIRAAGENADDIAARMASAAPLVPGSIPTAAQVAESGGIAALERAMAQASPEEFATRGMQQAAARTGALRQVAGDAGARAAAVEARKVATEPLYQQATQAMYTLDPRIEKLLQTPAMQQAMGRAQTLAQNNMREFVFEAPTEGGARQITGQGLQDLKMAIDAMLTDPASGYAGAAGDAVKNLRGQLLNWMEGANPAFKTARSTYAEMSKPISQMDIGSELLNRLEPALADYGGLARETGNKYATALRNADQTARAATGFKGAGMADVMEPAQMETLTAIARDLGRKANAQELGRGVGSDTFQKLAMANVAEQSGAPRLVGLAANAPGLSRLSQFAYEPMEEQIKSIIAKSLLDPAMGARLIREQAVRMQPASTGSVLLQNPARVTQMLGGGAGLTLSNAGSE